MEVVYSDLSLLGGRPEDNVRQMLGHGAGCVELMMDGGGWDNYPDRAADILSALKGQEVVYALHSPCWDNNMTSENHCIREASLASNLEAVDFAAALGAVHLVVHPGFCQTGVFDRAQAVRRSKEALQVLANRAGQKGIMLAVENVGYNGSSLYTQEEYSHLLDGFPQHVRYLIDTGHAVLNGWDIPQLIGRVAGRLCGIHLHDNDGVADSHLPIGKGVIRWEPVFEAIKALEQPCSLILEYNIGTPMELLEQSSQWLKNNL